MTDFTLPWLQLYFCLTLVILAAGYDVTRGRIPNWLTAVATVLGVGIGALSGGWDGVFGSVAGFSLGAALLGVMYLTGGMGAGEVKVLAAIGALKGPIFVSYTFVFMGLVGGAFALYFLARRWRFVVHKGLRAAGSFPYGPAIALGCVVAVLVGL